MIILQYQGSNIKVVHALICSVFFICLLLSWRTVYADGTSLFKYNHVRAGLDPATSKLISPAAISYDIVEVNANILISNEEFSIELLDGVIYKAITTQVQHHGQNSRSWRGDLVSPDGLKGSATVTVMNGVTSGLINLPGATYELVPLSATQSFLQEIDSSLYPPEHPDEYELDSDQQENDNAFEERQWGHNQENFQQPDSPPPPVRLNQFDAEFSTFQSESIARALDSGLTTGNPQIDVLVVYTGDARSAAGGAANIKSIIQNAIDVSNTAYANSNVPQRLNLVHAGEVNYNEVNDLGDALNWVNNNATVASLRNTLGADLVALVTEGGVNCGLGYVMRTVDVAFENLAFSAIKRSCAVANLSFAHELGHNMGLEHDPANGVNPADASYPYSFAHFVNGKFRTVMSYSDQCSSGCTKAPHFSNPSKNYIGIATGISNQRDNARALRNTDSIVAAFRAGTPGAPTLISPTGDITDNTPNYRWHAVPTASWYQLYVNDSSGKVINKVISAADTNCSSGTGTCSLTPTTALALGNGNWGVIAWNGKWGPWSSVKNFRVMARQLNAN